MIEINLATKKQASYAMGGSKEVGTQTFLGRIPIAKEDLEELPIKKIALTLIACLMGTFILDDFKSEKIEEVDLAIQKKTEVLQKLKKDSQKTAGIEKIQKSLEADEFVIRSKISTIQSLIKDRRYTAEMMISLSQVIPEDVWLKRFSKNNKAIVIQGQSKDFNYVSDFMKKLGQSSYFTNLVLKTTEQVNVKGATVAAFTLNAENKKE